MCGTSLAERSRACSWGANLRQDNILSITLAAGAQNARHDALRPQPLTLFCACQRNAQAPPSSISDSSPKDCLKLSAMNIRKLRWACLPPSPDTKLDLTRIRPKKTTQILQGEDKMQYAKPSNIGCSEQETTAKRRCEKPELWVRSVATFLHSQGL
jgi:hypothetical protein